MEGSELNWHKKDAKKLSKVTFIIPEASRSNYEQVDIDLEGWICECCKILEWL